MKIPYTIFIQISNIIVYITDIPITTMASAFEEQDADHPFQNHLSLSCSMTQKNIPP
jgi:hypothetical protein